MKKYILDVTTSKDFTATSKARKDIDSILENEGFIKKTIEIGKTKQKVIKEIHAICCQLTTILQTLEDDSELVVQYPWPTMSYRMAKIIKKQAKKKRIKTILTIHDVNSIRTASSITRLYYKMLVREIDFMDSFDCIICHTPAMKKHLIQEGIDEKKIVILEIFDYLVEGGTSNVGTDRIQSVNIAGNLSRDKTGYIYRLPELNCKNYCFQLYGPSFDGSTDDAIHYNGKYPAEQLPQYLREGFGLVWDGTEITTCSGNFGKYLKFNSPHKLSLYMACGIPVIVWADAAIAQFVKKNRVGFCIQSLQEIDHIMREITREEYAEMHKNVAMIQKKVRCGDYMRNAYMRAEVIIGNER